MELRNNRVRINRARTVLKTVYNWFYKAVVQRSAGAGTTSETGKVMAKSWNVRQLWWTPVLVFLKFCEMLMSARFCGVCASWIALQVELPPELVTVRNVIFSQASVSHSVCRTPQAARKVLWKKTFFIMIRHFCLNLCSVLMHLVQSVNVSSIQGMCSFSWNFAKC